jgi:hypothetical protein
MKDKKLNIRKYTCRFLQYIFSETFRLCEARYHNIGDDKLNINMFTYEPHNYEYYGPISSE